MQSNRLAGLMLAAVILVAFVRLPKPAGVSNAAEIEVRPYYQGILKRSPEWTINRTSEVVAPADPDPRVVAGRVTASVYTWYGPTGITYDGDE